MNYVIAIGVKQSAKRREVAKSNRGNLIARDKLRNLHSLSEIAASSWGLSGLLAKTGKNVLNRIFTSIKKSSGDVSEYY